MSSNLIGLKFLKFTIFLVTLISFLAICYYANVYKRPELFGGNLTPVKTAPRDDISCLAQNIYHEARGEGDIGMVSVAFVTLNRVLDGRYGKSVCDVVFADKQFSWTSHKNLSIKELKSWQRSVFWAEEIYKSKMDSGSKNIWMDPTEGSTHYYAPKKANPKWKKAGFEFKLINNHKFMKLATK